MTYIIAIIGVGLALGVMYFEMFEIGWLEGYDKGMEDALRTMELVIEEEKENESVRSI